MSGHLDYEINKELGECYLFMGELDKAEEYYRKAMGSNGVHPDPYLGLATIAVQRGELSTAMTLYRKAASIAPDYRSLTGMGLIEAECGDNQEAFAHLSQALENNPENLVALFSLVRLAYQDSRFAEIVGHLENYLKIDPQKHEVRYSLAGCLVSLGQHGRACEHLEKILSMDPVNQAALELLENLRADAA